MADALARFIEAQDAHGTYARVRAELRGGRKQSHWMWFVFPQLVGLGRSEVARRYGIADLDEARAYAAHPVLGDRLVECTSALLELEEDDPVAILGSIDARKLRSSMTLFERACPDEPTFAAVLERLYAGARDELTLDLLDRSA